ncbi:MAG: GYD domain-containing protein [Halobacteriota archaeon]
MPTYIALLNFTEQGISTVESSPHRVDAAKDLAEELGGEYKDFFLTFGQYDGVAILEFPDDETAAQFALTIGKAGNASTETLKAFTEDEFGEIAGRLS